MKPPPPLNPPPKKSPPTMHLLAYLLAPLLSTLATATEDWTHPNDKLINPHGKKVCLDQCGTVDLQCPEAFWREQQHYCFRCCSTWGETVIRVECGDAGHDEKGGGGKKTQGE
ncbi:hypothetical protein BDW02DRAFT_21078 [Decorospora gaudefroyi]|uniref:Uncharacterized protein n=1 Tax=Decorospora gaudefroyi TaxID=184978 RepID=A0A6A5K7W1_9PLEO|nr:hypothetical protein BDW02DRAFT_21078 [Decorospora gaudefroyi]